MSETTKAFWDTGYAKDEAAPDMPDGVDRAASDAVQFFGALAGKRVLDLGCGSGGTSVFLAWFGADVTAVDYSHVAIQGLADTVAKLNIKTVTALEHDAMTIDELGQFDFIFGSLILHHLEPFSTFCDTLRRTLKPGGRAFFYENNAASELLIWFRRNVVGKLWVPRYGDEDEFPLMPSEVAMLRKHFEVEIKIPEMVFVQLASAYLLKRRLTKATKAIDRFLYSINAGTKYSYRQYVMLRG